jgi:DNA-binding XRE family transcriptional regulator
MQPNSKEEYKKIAVDILVDELPSLRAKIGISQDRLAEYVGLSRQTLSAIETRKRPISWQTFLSIVLYFTLNTKTNTTLKLLPGFIEALQKCFDYDESE